MPQLVAIEYTASEARVAAASTRGSQVVIEQAFSVPLAPAIAGAGSSAADFGEQIAAALHQRGLGRQEALVAISRASIELRLLHLPAAPDEELPEMVRFQAIREFNELDEKWPLDFVPIDHVADGPRTVLAAAIAPALMARVEGVCQKAGLKPRRMVLRSCAAASLLVRAKLDKTDRVCLLVDLLSDEADLTVLVDGKPIVLRTTRLVGDPPPAPALLAEIRMTMAAVVNQTGGRKVESIVLCGHGETHAALVRQIEQELKTSAKLFDPFTGLELGGALRDSPPEHRGRFAPVLGMLTAELEQTGHAIDFLHPRRRVEPRNRRRQWIAVGAAAAVVLLAYMVWGRVERYLLADQVVRLEAQAKQLDAQLAPLKKDHPLYAEIAKWADGEVVWLDQLYSLSKNFPAAQDAMLGELICESSKLGNSQVDLKGWTRGNQTITKMEENVRARGVLIGGKSGGEDRSVRPYTWHFEAKVTIPRGAKS
jgi:Tfp pilus assembly PilM family ATPase